ncbi:MAG: hypothetical protein ACJAZO_001159 [Myxococcota bacterium]|jgi:hypothetical protein
MKNAGWMALLALATVSCKGEIGLTIDGDDVDGVDDDSAVASDDGPSPNIQLLPEALSFGTKLPDCPTDPSYITIRNIGDADLNINDIMLDGGNGVFDMTTIHDFSNGDLTLAPGADIDVPITFEAAGTVDYNGTLEVASNDPDEPNASAGVEGAGGDSATNEDLFFQAEPEGVDVLWVLDNSCSMSSYLTDLETEFDSFIASFTTLGLDYQLAVTTTDMDNPLESGNLLGPVPVISPQTAADAGLTVQEAFDAAVEPSSMGSGSEKALLAAQTALSAGGPAQLAGLIRPEANLAIIVVGDEDDASSLSAGNFVTWFEGLKNDPGKTTVSGILQQNTSLFDPNCSGFGSPKLEDVVDQTQGIRTSICGLDFDQVLRWLSYSAAGLFAEFQLTGQPLNGAAGMNVYVNGQQVSPDPFRGDGWWYVGPNNSVVFYGDSIPGPSAEVRIEYPVAGTCE